MIALLLFYGSSYRQPEILKNMEFALPV